MTDIDTRWAVRAGSVVFARSAHVLRPATDGTSTLPADAWPVFAFAVPDSDLRALGPGRALLDALAAPQPVRLLDTPAAWTVLSEDPPLLCLHLSTSTPAPFALSIAVAAGPFAHRLGALAAGTTVAITTEDRARALTSGIGTAEALDALILARAEPSAEVESLAAYR